ncbi:hypothetical protein ACLKA6_009580 [Drosophila palustris]
MESDDGSSSSSSESPSNSRPATPTEEAIGGDGGGDGVSLNEAASPAGSGSSSSSSSNSSSSSSHSDRSKAKKKSSSSSSGSDSSGSSSSSSSDEDDNDDNDDEPRNEATVAAASTPANSDATGNGDVDGDGDGNGDGDGDAKVAILSSPSNNKSEPSSSLRSRSNSPEQLYNQTAVDLNISHEDLSDVSDIDMEKQAPPSKDEDSIEDDDDDDDDDEEGALSCDSLPGVSESPTINGKSEESPSESGSENDVIMKETQDVEKANGLDDLVKAHDDDALDFEAEEGECPDLSKETDADNDVDGGVNTDGKALKNKNNGTEAAEEAEEGSDDERKGSADEGDGEVDDNSDESGTSDSENAKKKKKADEELEEGEVSDEDEKRPEETEPKPVCRFYTRGQCTWGMSCRFLHPGVTDKGNYTMFESLVRSVPMQSGGGGAGSSRAPTNSAYNSHMGGGGGGAPAGDYHDYRNERPAALHHRSASAMHHGGMYGAAVGGGAAGAHHDARSGLLMPDVPVVVENAWERGLRTAKEMMRKANKRKEQDMDFEDKKMNLTLSPDELEKDPYYLKERGTSPSVVRELPPNNPIAHGNPRAMLNPVYSMYGQPPDRYRAPYLPPIPYEDVDVYGRMARYRELPPHRMPQYEDDRRLRPAREVIVQRVEAVGRGDEWSDPWMRSKSIGRGASYEREERRRRDRRSYSSNSSYSSSNSSQSDSSSDSSRSSSASEHKRRYSHKLMTATTSRRHAAGRVARSPSQIPRRPRRSPKGSASPSYKRSALEKRAGGAHSPVSKRKKLSSPAPKKLDKLGRRRRSSSSSDSDTSYSDSDSGSSSSDSSSGSRETPQKRVRATDKALNERKLIKKPTEQSTKKRSPISIEIKKPSTMVGVSALASPVHSPESEKDKDNKGKDKDKDKDKEKDKEKEEKDLKKTRREELLKQLRAVEDAIAKKRSKLT